ncbi:MAG: hypothetical protein HRU19_26350 [Pseudobacteriovorax sp.]|nr:hypothetical protein [Pseudobacteriovorax sp.]
MEIKAYATGFGNNSSVRISQAGDYEFVFTVNEDKKKGTLLIQASTH